MTLRFDDIGNRLKAFRLGSGLSADEIANRLGISRTAVYRFEKGEVAKIDTLAKLAAHPEVERFVRWLRAKPDGIHVVAVRSRCRDRGKGPR